MNKAAITLCVLLFFCRGLSEAVEVSEWKAFKEHFISRDGHVIDYVNDRITTSEGQSYAMVTAVRIDDRQTFDLLWKWSRNNLQVRTFDSLLAWKWGERVPGTWDVIDLNNATDGDMLTAAALLDAARKWKDESYRTEALAIMKSVREKLIVEKWGKLFTLPGYFGFMNQDTLIINPSYLIVSAYKKFAQDGGQDFWDKVYRDSLDILSSSVYGTFGLPADWTEWNASGPHIYSKRNDLFGYEAVRVLLYLSWDDNVKMLKGLEGYLDFVERIGFLPALVDLKDNTMSFQEASGGFYAVFARAAADLGRNDQSQRLWNRAKEKIRYEKDDYYSHILYLLSKIKLN